MIAEGSVFKDIKDHPEQVTVSKYWQRGGIWTLRSALSWDHEENEYNCFLLQHPGLNPELYGVEKPMPPHYCPHCKRPMG